MRYAQLFEVGYRDQNDLVAEDINDIAALIKRDCQPYLKEVMNSDCLLVRGLGTDGQSADSDVYLRDRSTQRHFENTSFYDNQELSELMMKDGFKATRSNSTFCFSNSKHDLLNGSGSVDASMFGDVYVIFPIGRFDMTWMEPVNHHTDLGDSSWVTLGLDIIFTQDNGDDYQPDSSEIAKTFWNEYRDKFHNNINLKTPTALKTEIMITNTTFHAVNLDYFKYVWEAMQ